MNGQLPVTTTAPETKVTAGYAVGQLLGLLFAFVPSLRTYISPELAVTLIPLVSAFVAYWAPHTYRPPPPPPPQYPPGTVMTSIGPVAPSPLPAPPAPPAQQPQA